MLNGKQRQAAQSCLWIWEALVKLLQEQDYQTIKVADICQEAGLSRRTFYRYFDHKDDLIDYYCHNKTQDYITECQKIDMVHTPFEEIWQRFFEFWWQERDIVRLLIEQQLFYRVSLQMTQQLSGVYTMFDAPWHLTENQEEIDYIMSFSIGGLFNVLNKWLVKAQPESPEKVARTLIHALNFDAK